MKIGSQEQLFIIITSIILLITGIWALGSKKGLYVFGTISIIVSVILVLQYLNRGTVKEVKIFENEQILYEEEGVKVNIRYINKSAVAPDCKVTLTNLRIIIGKRLLFSSQYQESFRFYFTERNPEKPSSLSLTAVSTSTSLKDVVIRTHKDQPFIYFDTQTNVTSIKNVELHLKECNQFIEKLKKK